MSDKPIIDRIIFATPLRAVYNRLRVFPIFGSFLGVVVNWCYPQGSRLWVKVQTGLLKGAWMHLDPRYELSYSTGQYENIIQNVLKQHLHPGDTFYEIGSHIGFLSLSAARLVGDKGEVVAFEADPANAARIEEHIGRNSLRQTRVIPQAVWSRSGQLRFKRASLLSSRNTGAVLNNSDCDSRSEIIEVEAVSLDDYVRVNRPPCFIKIDVEGAEMHVLEGAANLISEKKPVLLCEIHSAEIGSQAQTWLRAKSYNVEWLSREALYPRHFIAMPLHK
jgi:FkbM family methyltransferase